ncbi:MAG: LamB/YcsF family protein [Sphingobacteriales bacterium]|nr:MAG: LamB/YcsF family protein [Sphingobacteriales bacterium]
MQSIDINCDMGESTKLWPYAVESDLALLQFVSSINIACGAHAGDAATMQLLLIAAAKNNIACGAHPSFEDKENFGRTNHTLPPAHLYEMVTKQIKQLQTVAANCQATVTHVKPHGALYNMAAKDYLLSQAIAQAVKDAGIQKLYGLSGSQLIKAADELGLQAVSEVFADRTYQPDGSLTPRTAPNALIEEEGNALQQVLQMIQQHTVTATYGTVVAIKADTVCIHSDGKHALQFAKMLHQTLQQQQVIITAPTK